MTAAVVYVTVPNQKEAESLAQTAVNERLAACANIIPQIKSVYRWEGETHMDQESLLLFKTTQARVPELMDRIQELHSYEVPCITSWPLTEIHPDYLQWIQQSTQSL
ncbi:MAG: divalent-cation tolerance protein CutA [Planctomycetaceae bacterium]|nr:divalent-cation tolerance protein CutA [Planctomycetaceae bacterium]